MKAFELHGLRKLYCPL